MDLMERDRIEKWEVENPDGLDPYAGKWVAITGKGVIASADSLKELAAKKGVDLKKVLVTRAPTIEENNAIWVLTQSVGRKNFSL